MHDEDMGERVRLRRSLIARLRFSGALELPSLAGPLVIGLIIDDAAHGRAQQWGGVGDVLFLAAFLGACFAVRAAVWFEYVEADATSLRWRSLFRSDIVPAERIVKIDVARMHFVFEKYGADVLRVHHESGSVRKVRPSAWCGRKARDQWLRDTADLWRRSGTGWR
jgi:hypothetical protein